MGVLTTNITADTFNSKMSHEYELYALISTDEIHYIVLDAYKHVQLLRSFRPEQITENQPGAVIREAYIFDKDLSIRFKKTMIAINSGAYTLIPEPYYVHEDIKTYLRQVTSIDDNTWVFSNNLTFSGIRNVAAITVSAATSLKNYFTDVIICHSLSPVIIGYQQIARNKSGKQLFLNLQHQFVQMVLFDGENLIFTNQFKFLTGQDFLYYLMLVFDQFGLDQEETPVLISGFLLEDSEIYKTIYRYVRHTGFISPPAHVHFSEQFRAVNHHFYYNLYNMSLCES